MSDQERRTVRLDMEGLYQEAVELVGESEAARLWRANKLDGGEKWPGKWAKAMEIVEQLRSAVDAD